MHCRYYTLMVLAIIGSGFTFAHGQTVRDAGGISNNIKISAAPTDQDRTAIETFIKTQVAKLTSADPAEQATGRDSLCTEVLLNGRAANPVYVDTYATAIESALTPLLSNPSLRVRLNAAIIISRVAERADSIRLKNIVILLLNDKSESVALWGMKTARHIVPVILRSMVLKDDPLVHGLVPAIKNRLSGPLTTEAYLTLRLDVLQNRKDVTPAMLQAVIPDVLQLMKLRTEKYLDGVPEDPQAESLATSFLTFEPVWSVMTPAQQLETMQTMSDLIGLAGQQAAAACRPDAPNKQDAELINSMLRLVGSAVKVIGDTTGNASLSGAAKSLSSIDPRMTGPTIAQTCTAVCNAIKATPNFKTIRPMPTVKSVPAPVADAAQPTKTGM